MAIFLIVMSFGLWGVFLAIQTTRHRSFFVQPEEPEPGRRPRRPATTTATSRSGPSATTPCCFR